MDQMKETASMGRETRKDEAAWASTLELIYCVKFDGQRGRKGTQMKKIEKRLQPLADLRELASSESVESFTLVYSNILQNHPDCPPEVVEKIVALREGIPKKDAREVLQECKEIYSACLANGDLPKPGFLFARLTCLTKATLPKKL